MPEAGQKWNVKFRILTLHLDRVPPPNSKKQSGMVYIGASGANPGQVVAAAAEDSSQQVGERRTDAGRWGVEVRPFRGLRAPFLPGVPGRQSQTLDVLLSRVHQGVRQSRLGGGHGNGIK